MVNASKMEGNTTHSADNSTLNHYRVCLYQGQESAEYCISGNVSSLPLESRIIIWKTVFGEKAGDEHDMQESVTDVLPAEAKLKLNLTVVVSICATVLSLACLVGMCIYRLRRAVKKMLTRNALITIPNIDIEMEPVQHSRFKINNTEDLFDDETCSLENQAFLKHTSSSSSVVEFLELDVSLSNPSSVESLTNPDNNSSSEWQDEGHYSDKDAGKVVQHNKGKRENKVHILTEDGKNMHAVIKKNETALDHIIMKCDVMHVKSPAGRSNQEEQNDDNEIIPINASNTIQSTNNAAVDNIKYNWTEIFYYLARELIDPKAYVLFFNILLAQAGCENSDMKISTIEADTKGNVSLTIFRILQYWKQGMGSNINPEDIEDAFIKLELTSHLNAFRSYMRNPPLLEESKKWNEPLNEHGASQLHFRGSHGVLPMIPEEGQVDICIQKYTFRHNSNGVNTSALQSATSTSSTPESGYGSSSNTTQSNSGQFFSESEIMNISAGLSQQGQALSKASHSSDTRTLNGQGQTNEQCQMSPKTSHVSDRLNGHEQAIQHCHTSQQGTMRPATSHTCDIMNGKKMTSQQCQMSPETGHTNDTQNENEQTSMQHTTSELQHEYSCQATSSGWKVSASNNHKSESYNQFKVLNVENRKRHIRNTDGGLNEYPLETKKKYIQNIFSKKVSKKLNRKRNIKNTDDHVNTYPFNVKKRCSINMERKFKHAVRPNNLLTHLVECIEKRFESNEPVDQDKYDIFVNDLLTRLTERPQKMDILSLQMKSYSTADSFTTREGEIIHVIHSDKHKILIREKEWSSLRTYVEQARAYLIEKTKTDFLFLCYDGTPLVHKW